MQLPSWLAGLTGAGNMMDPSRLDSFVSGTGPGPTLMDGLNGIGHDMMEHFRAGQARTPMAVPGATTAPGMPGAPALPPAAPPIAPPVAVPAAMPFTPAMGAMPPDLQTILQNIGHGVAPHIPQGVPLSKIQIHFGQPGGGGS